MGDGNAEAIGGLYVAVGVEGDTAIREAKQVHDWMARIAHDIDRIGRNANFNKLTSQLRAVNNELARTKAGMATAGTASTSRVQDPTVVLKKQMDNMHTMALAEDRRRQAMAEASAAARLKIEQTSATREIDQAHKAALAINKARNKQLGDIARTRAAEVRVSQAAAIKQVAIAERQAIREVRAAQAARWKELALIQGLAIAENRARDKMAKAAERQALREIRAAKAARGSSVGGVKRGLADFATGGAAAASGNPAYAIANVVQGLTKMSAAMGLVGASGGAMATGIGAVIAVVVALTVAAAALELGLAAIAFKLAQFGVQTAASFETLQLQLEGLLGSAKKGRDEMNFLLDLGKTSIVPTESLIAADRQLVAFGVQVTSQRRQLIQFISDFGTATSATEQQIYFLSLAIGQVAARGKANQVDLNQLGNAGITTRSIYKGVAKEIGVSWQKVRDGVKDGIITSDALIAAISKMGGAYEKTAKKARNSTNGLMANIKDVVTVGMGRAFGALNKQFGRALQGVMKFVEGINFDRIAIAVQNFFAMIQNALGTFSQDSGDAAYFFNTTLPEAIEKAGIVAGAFIRTFGIGWEALMISFNASKGIFAGVGMVMIGVIANMAMLLDKANLISDEAGQNVADWAESTNKTLNGWLQESVDGVISASAEMNKKWAVGSIKWLEYRITATQVGINNGQVPKQANDEQPQWYKDMLARMAADANNTPVPDAPTGGGGGGTDPRVAKLKAVLDEWKKLLDTAIEARKALFQAFNIPFKGMLEGVLKPEDVRKYSEAFADFASGDFTTIVGRYKATRQAILELYDPAVKKAILGGGKGVERLKARRDADLRFLENQTSKLVRLAAQSEKAQKVFDAVEKAHGEAIKAIDAERKDLDARYKVRQKAITRQYDDYYTAISATEGKFYKGTITLAQEAVDASIAAYDQAQAKLDEMVAERDDFLASLRDSARDFVNDLQDITTEITTYTRLDSVGSFSTTTSEKASLSSFKDNLAKRLATLKTWVAQVRDLMARGLNGDLLKQIVEGGPQDTADLVAQLAGGSAEDLAGINDIQNQLAASIAEIQKASSAQWYDAGIAAQEAYTAPLKAAAESAQKHLDELTAQKDLALGVLEAWNTEQTELLDERQDIEDAKLEAARAHLEAVLAANQAKAEQISAIIDARLQGLPKTAYAQGLSTVQGLIDGLSDDAKLEELKAAARRVANAIRNSIDDTLGIHSPAKVAWDQAINYGGTLAAGLDHTVPLVDAAGTRLANAVIQDMPTGGYSPISGDTYVDVMISEEMIEGIAEVVVTRDNARSLDVAASGRVR